MYDQAKLSICMVSDDFLPAATGVGIHLQTICPHLVKLNHEVSVITTRRPGQPTFETWQGVSVYRIATVKVLGFYQGLPSSDAIRKIVSQVRPHVIHFHYVSIMLLRALKIAEGLHLPKVYTYHMTEDHLTQPLPMRPFRRAIARQIVNCCNRTDLVISVSQALASELPRRGIRTPIRYISNPVAFRNDTSVKPVARDGAFVVMFAGRLDPEKNLPYLLRGFSKMLDSMPEAVLWLAGKGAQKKQLQSRCRDLGISNRVRFLGLVDHDVLSSYYAACDVFVLPSLVETQGLVAMEAMWFGKPLIVARSIVSAAELVDEGHNGFIVDQSSDSDLVHRLMLLGSDSELRARMGAAGRQKAEAYRPQVVVEALETAYTDTLRRFDRKSSQLNATLI